MRIILLYGAGEVSKRDALIKIKSKFDGDSIFTVDLKKESEKDLLDMISSTPLFVTDRLIVVENAPTSLDISKLPQSESSTLVLVAGSLIATSILLKTVKAASGQVTPFEGEKEVNAFNFLDALIEGRKQVAFLELDKLLKEHGGIYVLSMIYYLLRRNLLPLPKSDFMARKIQGQGSRVKGLGVDWSELYRKTLETEYKIKSGLIDEVMGLTTLTQSFM